MPFGIDFMIRHAGRKTPRLSRPLPRRETLSQDPAGLNILDNSHDHPPWVLGFGRKTGLEWPSDRV